MVKSIFSYGGGVQSFACLVLATQGELHYDAFVFSNVGNKAERPETLEHIENVAKPLAAAHNIPFIELTKTLTRGPRKGQTLDLYDEVYNNHIAIPAFTVTAEGNAGGPLMRNCTKDYKIVVINQWARAHGVTHISYGISLDEWTRMKTFDEDFYTRLYPLIERQYTREDCHLIINEAGFESPPKSACFFCPYTKTKEWATLKEERPDLFYRAADLEARINQRRALRGLPPVYLSQKRKPLYMIPLEVEQEEAEDNDPTCDSGHCFT